MRCCASATPPAPPNSRPSPPSTRSASTSAPHHPPRPRVRSTRGKISTYHCPSRKPRCRATCCYARLRLSQRVPTPRAATCRMSTGAGRRPTATWRGRSITSRRVTSRITLMRRRRRAGAHRRRRTRTACAADLLLYYCSLTIMTRAGRTFRPDAIEIRTCRRADEYRHVRGCHVSAVSCLSDRAASVSVPRGRTDLHCRDGRLVA